MTNRRIFLSFAVGPVQGFVAQARRTRDLWAGSWLLSYLTECALAAAETAGGRAIIPHRGDSERTQVTTGTVGGIPNRFELIFTTDEEARTAARQAEAAFRTAWRSVANAVWGEYVEAVVDQGSDTSEIWRRQVESFWELSWVIGAPGSGEKTIGRLAAVRKAFRNIPATKEPGAKCSLMGNLQELSGHAPGEKQRAFWDKVRERVGEHDLGETERLCAVAVVKRLFPRVIEAGLGERIREATIEALRDQIGWPSTAFFAAWPWLATVTDREDTKQFAEQARAAGIGLGERQAAREARLPDWAGVDATAWFPNALEQNEWGIEKGKLNDLLKELRKLHQDVGNPPAQHYALLMMDGDSMGSLLSQLGDPGKLSECLGHFAGGVDDIVGRCSGRPIYAGGDDVLVMLPANEALQAACQLAQAYGQSFEETLRASDEATLSGAIVFAPWKFPLRQVLETGHHLLDEVAKDRTGRDALAIGILQNSGLNAVWSAPWSVVRGEEKGVPPLDDMLDAFGTDDADQDRVVFNASYLYHLRGQFGRLIADFREEPGHFAEVPEELVPACDKNDVSLGLLGDIAHAEYRRRMSREERKSRPPPDTRAEVGKLMALSRKWDRDIERDPRVQSDPRTFSFDGWRVARFLRQVQKG